MTGPRWYCRRCGITSRPQPHAREAERLGLMHYELCHRDDDTAAMAARAENDR